MDSTHMLTMALAVIGVFLLLLFLVYPLLLSGFNKLVSGFWSKYWRTLGTVVLTGIIAGVVSLLVGLAFKGHAQEHVWTLRIVSLVVTAVVGGGLLKAFVKRADGEPLPYSKTFLTYLLFGIAVTLIGMATQPWFDSVGKQFKAYSVQARQAATAPATTTTTVEATPAQPAAATSAAPAMAGSTPAPASSAS